MSRHAVVAYDKAGGYTLSHCTCGWRSNPCLFPMEAAEQFRRHVQREEVELPTGRQSDIGARFDLIDPTAALTLARVLHEGAEVYGEGSENWKAISVEDHLNHAVAHVYRHLGGDRTEDHLGHAFCRLMFAVAVEEGS